jgi:hypothetical protein
MAESMENCRQAVTGAQKKREIKQQLMKYESRGQTGSVEIWSRGFGRMPTGRKADLLN